MLQALVFDFDGVIVDSEPVHYQALLEIGQTFGCTFDYDAYLRDFIGFDDRDAFGEMFRRVGRDPDPQAIRALCAQKQVVFERLVQQGASAVPGAVALIDQAHAAGFPLAICSGATGRDIDLMLAGLDRRDRFELIISADDVARSKPDPACYALAAQQLATAHPDTGITPAGCLAIEDTRAGIAAATGAGLMTLGLTTTGPAHTLDQAGRVIENLAGVTLAQLQSWYDDTPPEVPPEVAPEVAPARPT